MDKESKIIYGISIVFFVLIMALAGTLYFGGKDVLKNKGEKFITHYFELLNNRDYDEMYNLLSTKSKEEISKEAFIDRNKRIYDGVEASEIEVNVNDVVLDNGQGQGSFNIKMKTLVGEIEFENVMYIETQDDYKVNWSSNLIFPELNNNYKVKVSTTKSKRGDILDRNGKKLATDSEIGEAGIVLENIKGNRNDTVKELSTKLDISEDFINNKLNQSYVEPWMFIPIKKLSYSDERINEILNIDGVVVQAKEARVYPLGEKAAHLTGYVQSVTAEDLEKDEEKVYTVNSSIGRAGLEYIYEERLRGVNGGRIYIVDDNGKEIKTVGEREVKQGENIKLTIDVDVQSLSFEALEGNKGASVSLNPDTGEVLSLVSSPSYNPNDFVLGMSTDKWNSLNNDENKPLFNRFQSNITPGSAFKPFTAAIGLETKTLSPNEDKGIKGLKWQMDKSWGGYYVTRIKDYGLAANLRNALVYSDNIYFAKAALDIGAKDFIKYLKNFGMGEKLPFEYGVSKSIISSEESLKNPILLSDSGYGQGEILMNPLQLGVMYTMFKNDGDILTPYLEYREDRGKSVWKEDVISKNTSDIILRNLTEVVSDPNGSGHSLKKNDVTIAGKTGTAEVKESQEDVKGTEIGWMVAMTTNQKNNILVTTFVEDVKHRGGSGFVIPIVKKIIDLYK